jgi:hypothetical protein
MPPIFMPPVDLLLYNPSRTVLNNISPIGIDFNNPNNVTRKSTTIPDAFRAIDGYGVYVPQSTLFDINTDKAVLHVKNTTKGKAGTFSGRRAYLAPYVFEFDFHHNGRITTGAGDLQFYYVVTKPNGTVLQSIILLITAIAP